MNTSEPQIITVRPSPKHMELKWFLGLLLLLSAIGYLHWTLGKVLAWWLLIFLILLLTGIIIGLGLWLLRGPIKPGPELGLNRNISARNRNEPPSYKSAE